VFVLLGLVINTALAVLLLIHPAFFARLLGVEDGSLMDMSVTAIRLFALGMPLQLINSVLLNYYQCTRKVGMATMICLLQSLVYTVLFALILIRPMGANGAWMAILLGDILTLETVGVVMRLKTGKFPLSVDTVMLLGDTFAGSDKDRLELSIGNSMEEVMAISTGIHKFGRNRDLDKQTLNLLSLCIEEMAGNVVRHAFKPGEKRWLDLTVIDKPDALILRIRDNGAAFDPLAYDGGADATHYGIRMIRKLADTIEYRRSMGLNNLIIHLAKEAAKE
jgi:anti-sigma regulatory factor (Ser/Thr protein kinase)